MAEPAPRVLLLGAGASYGARTGDRPPLGKHLGQYLLCWLQRNDPEGMDAEGELEMHNGHSTLMPHTDLWRRDLDGTRKQYDELRAALQRATQSDAGFESEMHKLVDANRFDLLSLLHRALTWSMLTGRSCRFREQTDLFDELFSSGQRPDLIITLNYDTLLEEALQRLQIAHFYPTLDKAESGIPVYKLHGSINFRQLKGAGASADFQTALSQAQEHPTRLATSERNPSLWTTDTAQTYVVRGRSELILELKQALNTREPVIAAYAPNKPAAVNPLCLTKHRQECRARVEQLRDADVTAIGIRFPSASDDPDLDHLTKAFGDGTKLYVSPDPEDCRKAENLGFEARPQTFEDFVRAKAEVASSSPYEGSGRG